MSVDMNNLTEEEKKALEIIDDQKTKLGEVFSQCWESEEFKEAFKQDPKAIFDEYGINYLPDKEYRILETPAKTVIHVLPYEGIKIGLVDLNKRLMNMVEDIGDEDGKMIIPDGWSYTIVQNTENVINMPIPVSPENLTPEELELVNGGCLIFGLVFVIVTVASVTEVSAFVYIAVSLAMVAAAVFLAVAAESAFAVTTVLTVAEVATSYVGVTGAVVAGWGDNSSSSSRGTGVSR